MNTFNTITNYLYRYPLGVLKTSIKYGGPLKSVFVKRGKKQMQFAAEKLKFPAPNADAEAISVPICFLTGKRHWYLTAFCIYSFLKHTPAYKFKFILFDDGSIDEKISAYFLGKALDLEIVYREDIAITLQKKVPVNEYPATRRLRSVYINLKKITDVHSFGLKHLLFFDSDMLFFNIPKKIINWAKNPKGNIFIRDTKQSYGIDFELMKDVAKSKKVPSQLNAGLYGLNSANTDFKLLERWIGETKNPNGLGNYYWEQALTAMLIAQDDYEEAPVDEYIVKPNQHQVENKLGVLHHYVEVSQNLYYTKAWKLVI